MKVRILGCGTSTGVRNGLDYRSLVAEPPDWAAPAPDGLEIEL